MTAPARPRAPVVLLRPVPGDTVIHRLWAGTKLIAVAGITVALRRADEMGDAITARGGAGQISAAPSGPKPADWVALAIVVVVCAVALTLEVTILGTL
jgi:energy-coupling factor transporter transmembrane protein EcfT